MAPQMIEVNGVTMMDWMVIYCIAAAVFFGRYMIRKYKETGNKDYLMMLAFMSPPWLRIWGFL